MLKCLEGAYDLHVHSGPDVVKRKIDDIDLCKRYLEAGFKGYCIKSHYFCTAERARTMKQICPDMDFIGAISLNKTVGGLNAEAVDVAGRDGAKLVWMPTFDAANEISFILGDRCTYDTKPAWMQRVLDRRDAGVVEKGYTVLGEDGKLTKETLAVMEAIAAHGMVLCTGHLSIKEIYAVVKAAPDMHVDKVIVTHATWASIGLKKEQQLELAEMGAVIEHASANIKASYGTTWEQLYGDIRYVGARNCIISSDCGNVNKPYPDESIEAMVIRLLDNGCTEDDIRIMCAENPVRLVT